MHMKDIKPAKQQKAEVLGFISYRFWHAQNTPGIIDMYPVSWTH